MRVFSKEKFIEVEGYEVYLRCKDWVDECDGKRIVQGCAGECLSHKTWEVEK